MECVLAEEIDNRNVLDDLVKGSGGAVDPHTLDKLITKVDELKELGKSLESRAVTKKAYGLDIGTSRIVSMKQDGSYSADQLNAFIAVSETKFLTVSLLLSVKPVFTHPE